MRRANKVEVDCMLDRYSIGLEPGEMAEIWVADDEDERLEESWNPPYRWIVTEREVLGIMGGLLPPQPPHTIIV